MIYLDAELKPLERWIYREFKIDISAYKSNQMNRRLRNIMQRCNASSAEEYIDMLENSEKLRKKLADFITINVSEFFRNKDLYMDLEDKIKEYLIYKSRSLNIWSAACSNGAEPYSIAIILDKLTPNIFHSILGTDIDSTILEAAKKGEYSKNDIKNVDEPVLKKYFTLRGDKYLINPCIKGRVQFKKHDLILDPYGGDYDLIVCRNVVIYFTQEVKDKIYRKLYEALKPGGILFVGATESIINFRDFGFEKASAFIYRKKT